MELFKAPKRVGTFVSTILAIFLASNIVWADEGICRDAGLTGKGFGLCTAYCEAMDCDSESPNANETACGEVQSKFLETTGIAEMPCGAGTGEPPVSGLACPCDFAVDSWRDLMTDGTYPYQTCQVSVGPAGEWTTILFGVAEQPFDSGVWSNQLLLAIEIQDEDEELVKGSLRCSAIKYEVNPDHISYSPRPFGAVELYHTFEDGRLPIQTVVFEACKQDLQTLVDEFFPELECDDEDIDGDGVLAISDGGTDCDDYDSRVYPGSEYWGDQETTSGGYDYNCDGEETKQLTTLCSTSLENHCWYGSSATIPECGVVAQQLVSSIGDCSATTPEACTLDTGPQYCN